jgi:anti-sigma regulatory factor (Ser/Thr protein kinase)
MTYSTEFEEGEQGGGYGMKARLLADKITLESRKAARHKNTG